MVNIFILKELRPHKGIRQYKDKRTIKQIFNWG